LHIFRRFTSGSAVSSTSSFAWVLLVALVLVVGCSDPGGSTAPRVDPSMNELSEREQMGRRLLESASDQLNKLDNFDEGTIETALQQVIRLTNEGLATLPDAGSTPTTLTIEDGRILREAVWLRDGARYAVGDETDPLRRAERIFDWTIRNIQLIPAEKSDAKLPLLPWHSLLLGRATDLDRAWLFQLLARQQQLDVVLLAAPPEKPVAKPSELKILLAALVVDKQFYLFDARIGAPIRTKDGKQTATLAQATADDGLLRMLDLPNKPYPLKADDLKKLVAVLEASSPYLDPRFARIGRELAGRNRLELEAHPDKLEAQLKDIPGIASTVRWPLRDERYAASRATSKESFDAIKELLTPFNLPRTNDGKIIPSPLLKARVRHISGKYYENPQETDPALLNLSINFHYHQARPANEDLVAINAERYANVWQLALTIRQNATYWLGIVAYDLKNYETARDYFEMVLKQESSVDWTTGARYNLGRTYEALAAAEKDSAAKAELTKKALETYRATFLKSEPDDQSLERAKWLEGQAGK
jgi:tetratricopeptide (TPR) repeat protein